MLLTKYFISSMYSIVQPTNSDIGHVLATRHAIEQKESFLHSNRDKIEEIIREEIGFEICNSGNYAGHIFAIITFSYYPKSN